MQLEEITEKKVLVRLDYNVPIEDGMIVNDFRIRQTYNTLNSLLDNNNKLILNKFIKVGLVCIFYKSTYDLVGEDYTLDSIRFLFK